MTNAELHKIVAEQAATIATMQATLDRVDPLVSPQGDGDVMQKKAAMEKIKERERLGQLEKTTLANWQAMTRSERGIASYVQPSAAEGVLANAWDAAGREDLRQGIHI